MCYSNPLYTMRFTNWFYRFSRPRALIHPRFNLPRARKMIRLLGAANNVPNKKEGPHQTRIRKFPRYPSTSSTRKSRTYWYASSRLVPRHVPPMQCCVFHYTAHPETGPRATRLRPGQPAVYRRLKPHSSSTVTHFQQLGRNATSPNPQEIR